MKDELIIMLKALILKPPFPILVTSSSIKYVSIFCATLKDTILFRPNILLLLLEVIAFCQFCVSRLVGEREPFGGHGYRGH